KNHGSSRREVWIRCCDYGQSSRRRSRNDH
ncbi:mur ligase family, glutamate ligase domain protein, partial [Chlamydia psittaci 84-8471/1]